MTEDGMEIPAAIDSTTGINFQPTGDAKVAITREFLLAANEVNPVINALAASGIEVTALHSPMLTE